MFSFGRDAFGMILGYHEQDFKKTNSVYDSATTATAAWHVPGPTFLYNGNISSWAWNSRRSSGANDTALAAVYHYDLLNRLRSDSLRLHSGSAWGTLGSWWQTSYTYDGNGNIKSLYRANAASSQMDNLTYSYTTGTNKLVNIDDAQGASTGADLGDQSGNNYAYDATGNMTQDTAAGIEAGGIVWSPYNKIKSITKMGESPTSKLAYLYDAQGNRVMKRYYVPDDTRLTTTWYVRDAQGNTLATYSRHKDSSQAWQSEAMVYGSARQAVVRTNAEYSDSYLDTISIFETLASRRLGEKSYELTDHLGNVRATVSDLLIDHSGSFDAELTTRTDYYPFGMIMGGRNYAADGAHRYGFNGKENDNEVKGEGNQQDYGFRIYDPRVARFLSVDPLTASYPSWSPFPFAMNRVIDGVDRDGLEYLPYGEATVSLRTGLPKQQPHAATPVTPTLSQSGEVLLPAYYTEMKRGRYTVLKSFAFDVYQIQNGNDPIYFDWSTTITPPPQSKDVVDQEAKSSQSKKSYGQNLRSMDRHTRVPKGTKWSVGRGTSAGALVVELTIQGLTNMQRNRLDDEMSVFKKHYDLAQKSLTLAYKAFELNLPGVRQLVADHEDGMVAVANYVLSGEVPMSSDWSNEDRTKLRDVGDSIYDQRADLLPEGESTTNSQGDSE